MATVIKSPPVEHSILFTPSLEDVVKALNTGMKYNFAKVKAEVVECPDLTQQPFTLAMKGLSGGERIVDVGGPPYLLPLVQRNKLYDIRDIQKKVVENVDGQNGALVVGAGAGPWPYAGVNCEMMVNLEIRADGTVNNHSRIAKVDKTDGSCKLERLPDNETRTALLSNLYCCEGKPGKVLSVKCEERIGSDDFITCIRKALQANFEGKSIGLGGTFLLKKGTANQHVMPDFSKTPITTDDGVNEWLNFYNMSAPLIAVGTLVSVDPGLDLRVQHFHSFSHHGEGGHYHNDTDPTNVQYEGYFSLAKFVYRVDRPAETHNVGRD